MSSRDLQQDAELEKQRERYRRKAEENVIRNLRLRDSRMRLIGINEQALKQQVEERDRQRQEEKQADRFDRQRNEEYSRILEQAAKEEDELRKAHMEELKASWARDAEQRRRNKAEEEGPSITSFIGHEDTGREERIRAQKEQLKRWLIEQANEHANRSMRDRQEDLAYADMLRAVAEVQEQAENEESMLRKELERRIGDENRRAAEGARQRALQEKRGANSGEGLNNTLPLWTKHGSGKDSFQGFDPETRRKILAENSELAAYRKSLRDAEKEEDLRFQAAQMQMQRAMDEAELEERLMREEFKLRQRAFLDAQIQHKKAIDARDARIRGEAIGEEFFHGFGVTWR